MSVSSRARRAVLSPCCVCAPAMPAANALRTRTSRLMMPIYSLADTLGAIKPSPERGHASRPPAYDPLRARGANADAKREHQARLALDVRQRADRSERRARGPVAQALVVAGRQARRGAPVLRRGQR